MIHRLLATPRRLAHTFRIALEAQQSHPNPPASFDPTAPGDKGLKADALGYISNLVIAVASTAPAYSLAATLGFIVAVTGVGVHSPAVLIVSFIPILFVSVGYRFLNLADPDAGHHVRLGDACVRAPDRLGQRLGDLPRRHHRDGVAGGYREQLYVPRC